MDKKLAIFSATLVVGFLLIGCASTQPPADSSAGLSGLQQRALNSRNIGDEFGASYDDVWYSTIATLQLNGFILRQADKTNGYIYGVWQDTYEKQYETSEGSFLLRDVNTSPGLSYGSFFSRTDVYKQIEVSVTLEPVAPTQTIVRLVARFDSEGVPMAAGVFANRFFGLLRKEIFLRVNNVSTFKTCIAPTSK